MAKSSIVISAQVADVPLEHTPVEKFSLLSKQSAQPISSSLTHSAKELPRTKVSYFPALDTVRALAVVEVVAYHCRVAGASSGWMGVDLFFALSGFLITYLLIMEFNAKHSISLYAFYIRRIARLFPALAFLLLGYVILQLYFKGPSQSMLEEISYSLLGVANWTRIYFHSPKNLGHLWSLAIEIQFYLLWAPVIAVLLSKKKLVPHIFLFSAAVIIAGEVWRAHLLHGGAGHTRLYNGFGTRVSPFALGATLACGYLGFLQLSDRWKTILKYCSYSACLLALGMHFFLLPQSLLHNRKLMPHLNFLLALPSIALIGASIFEVPTIISLQPLILGLRFLGKISYGIYLWHYQILQFGFARSFAPELRFCAVFGLSVLIAAISYLLIEKPIIRLTSHKLKARVAAP